MPYLQRIISLLAATLLLLAASSCGSDEPDPIPVNPDGSTLIRVKLPADLPRRPFSGLNERKQLHYAVYSITDPTTPLNVCPAANGSTSTSGIVDMGTDTQTTLRLSLPDGDAYTVTFWAMNPSAPFNFDASTGEVTLDTNALRTNEASMDAFSGSVLINSSTLGRDVETTLSRPLSMVSIGTNDYYNASTSGMKVEDAGLSIPSYTRYNLISGTVADRKEVTYASAPIPGRSERFPVSNFEYVAMGYVLTSTEMESVTVRLTVNALAGDPVTYTFERVHLQRGYRTNLFGSIFTQADNYKEISEADSEALQNPGWNGNRDVVLKGSEVLITNRQLHTPLTVSGSGTLVIDNSSISSDTDGEAAITIAGGANVRLRISGSVTLEGSRGAEAIRVCENASLEITGGNLRAVANNGREFTLANGYGNTTDNVYADAAATAIGNSRANEKCGTIFITSLRSLEALGYGRGAFGIGGRDATVALQNVTVKHARGGYPSPVCLISPAGTEEPEGGAAVGVSGNGSVALTGCTVEKAEGGARCPAIGVATASQGDVRIAGCTLRNVIGGCGAAAIGGGLVAGTNADLTLSILGSDIEALGGQYGAGIGNGFNPDAARLAPSCGEIHISGASRIAATGGEYAAGIGTGYRNNALSGAIATGVDTAGTLCGTPFVSDAFTRAMNIGYGVLDPSAEALNLVVTFAVGGTVIASPF